MDLDLIITDDITDSFPPVLVPLRDVPGADNRSFYPSLYAHSEVRFMQAFIQSGIVPYATLRDCLKTYITIEFSSTQISNLIFSTLSY